MSVEKIVIVAYRPFPGKEEQLKELMKTHVEILRKEGLVSARQSIVMQAKDATIVEVFGWNSAEALEAAHSNPVVLKMWEEYSKVCDYVPLKELNEAHNLFSEFIPVN